MKFLEEGTLLKQKKSLVDLCGSQERDYFHGVWKIKRCVTTVDTNWTYYIITHRHLKMPIAMYADKLMKYFETKKKWTKWIHYKDFEYKTNEHIVFAKQYINGIKVLVKATCHKDDKFDIVAGLKLVEKRLNEKVNRLKFSLQLPKQLDSLRKLETMLNKQKTEDTVSKNTIPSEPIELKENYKNRHTIPEWEFNPIDPEVLSVPCYYTIIDIIDTLHINQINKILIDDFNIQQDFEDELAHWQECNETNITACNIIEYDYKNIKHLLLSNNNALQKDCFAESLNILLQYLCTDKVNNVVINVPRKFKTSFTPIIKQIISDSEIAIIRVIYY